MLLAAWDELKALVYGQLMSQSHLSGLFQSIAYQWDAETESVVGDLTAVAQTLATRIDSDRDAGLEDLGDFLYSLKGMGLLNQLDVASFKAELLPLGTDVVQAMDAALKGWVAGGPTEGDDVLRGTEFYNFGAFFSRAYRENDYLWGRLHGVERMIDLIASALPKGMVLEPQELARFKREAFLAVLDEEEGRLQADPGLVPGIRAEVLKG